MSHCGLEQNTYQYQSVFCRSILDHSGSVVLGTVSNYTFKRIHVPPQTSSHVHQRGGIVSLSRVFAHICLPLVQRTEDLQHHAEHTHHRHYGGPYRYPVDYRHGAPPVSGWYWVVPVQPSICRCPVTRPSLQAIALEQTYPQVVADLPIGLSAPRPPYRGARDRARLKGPAGRRSVRSMARHGPLPRCGVVRGQRGEAPAERIVRGGPASSDGTRTIKCIRIC